MTTVGEHIVHNLCWLPQTENAISNNRSSSSCPFSLEAPSKNGNKTEVKGAKLDYTVVMYVFIRLAF